VQGNPLWFVATTLAPQAQSVAAARRFVGAHLTSHDLSVLVDDVTLVASELATNALAHAGTSFTVTLAAFSDVVVLVVKDGSAASPVKADADAFDDAGRGVAIVDCVSREWGVTSDVITGKSVWATFNVPR
jgi:3-hydroxyisobutyrate dehydrogenase-like beta-hydroxyacid dehydrogenase